MYHQDSISSTKTARIMERVRSLGNLTIAKNKIEPSDKQIVNKLDVSGMSDEEVLAGFYQLVEEDKIRSHEVTVKLGPAGVERDQYEEDRIIFSPV